MHSIVHNLAYKQYQTALCTIYQLFTRSLESEYMATFLILGEGSDNSVPPRCLHRF